MAEPYFPTDFEQVSGTPTLTLGVALYCIRATFFDPAASADAPVPPHVWLLLFRGTARGAGIRAIARSGPSDANGKCVLSKPAAKLEPGTYSLGLAPLPDDARKWYMGSGEAWIDLDTHTWASPPDGGMRVESRRLVRIPAWSTARKAQAGGGFKVAPPAASQFAQDGTIRETELVPFGSPASPWDMPLDFGWVKARVRYFFFNFKDNKQETLPPGLVVEAVRHGPAGHSGITIETVGKGCSVSPSDGTAYVLLGGDRSTWGRCDFQFRAPANVRVDVSSPPGNPDRRLTATGPLPGNPSLRNVLPTLWHSHGMRASYGAGQNPSPSPASAKPWDALRGDIANDAGSLEATVFFHLDDVVLCKGDGKLVPIGDSHQAPTLFDHFLTIIAPSADKRYQSDVKLAGSVLPADRIYAVGKAPPSGKRAIEVSTRLIHYEGSLHDLRDDRVGGEPGRSPCVGARAALANWHPRVVLDGGNPRMKNNGPYEIHAIDVPGVPDPSTAKPLQHMLLFFSFAIDKSSKFPAAMMPKVHDFLHGAAERWSPGHPGAAGLSTKRYALIPADPANPAAVVTRIRTFFGEVSGGSQLKLVLEHGDERSYQQSAFWFLFKESVHYFDSGVTADVAAAGGTARDSDGAAASWHTLAHEFGHALGLPDEYCEFLTQKDVDSSLPAVAQHPVLPKLDHPDEKWGTWRPFFTDDKAIMNSNELPRLRHLWHHVRTFNEDPAFSKLPSRPYLLVHETFGPGGITYPTDGSSRAPYDPAFTGVAVGGGHTQCALYPLGDDEASVEAMFEQPGAAAPSPRPTATRFNALLVVRPRIRFEFDSSMNAGERWTLIQDFQGKIYAPNYRPRIRFVLLGAGKFPRIAVLFQPNYSPGTSIHLFESTVDVQFEIVKSAGYPKPNPFLMDGQGSSLTIERSDWVFEPAFRYAIGAPTWIQASPHAVRTVNLAPIHPGDLQNIARTVEKTLGEAPGSRSVGVY